MTTDHNDDLDGLAEDIFSNEPGTRKTATMASPAAASSASPTAQNQAADRKFDTSDFDLDDEPETSGCPQCGSTEPWGMGSWCPDCGYYPATGQKPEAGESCGKLEATPARNLEHWWEVVPPWGWMLGAGVAMIVITGLVVRVAVPVETPARFWIALTFLVAGLICAGTAHFLSYMKAVMKDATLAPWDLFMKPFTVWKQTIRDLFSAEPSLASKKRAWVGGWGLAATLTALVVIGFNYNALFEKDWASEGADANVVEAIVEEARKQQNEGGGELDDAMNDFVGEKKQDTEEPTHHTDCLIVGYSETPAGALESIHLASVVKKKLKFVGSLPAEEIPKKERADLIKRFRKLGASSGFLEVPAPDTHYLQPVMMIRIGHFNWSAGKMKRPQFDSMLRDVE